MTREYALRPVSGAQVAGATASRRFGIDYERELNPAQNEAVQIINGPILCLAGAGSGKTRTLVYRVARMVENGILPESILLLTFTRKSAMEMLERAQQLIGAEGRRVNGGTYHSAANLILRRHGIAIGLPSNFSILDEGDSGDILQMIRADLNLEKKETRFPQKSTIKAMLSASINRGISIDRIISDDYPHFIEHTGDICRMLAEYAAYKTRTHLLDYDDLLLDLIRLLEEAPYARAELSHRYRFLMVDEYQDTNPLQARITRLLAGDERNVMAVGDDAQSIYAFRGADFRNILRFPEEFPGCRMVRLEENYRSTAPILDSTNRLMSHATSGFQKKLFTRRTGGEKPALLACADEEQQSNFVAQRILELREEGVPLSKVVVLFRSGFHSYGLELELRRRDIPYQKWGGFKFLEATHIKDVLAHLRILVNPCDQVSWIRVLMLLEGVGPRTAAKIFSDISTATNPFDLSRITAGSKIKEGLGSLGSMLCRLSGDPRPDTSSLIDIITDYYSPILKNRHDDFPKRLKDLDQLATIGGKYQGLEEFLADLTLEPPTNSVNGRLADDGEKEERLVLSTIHSAKGLEWHSVFVIWALEGRFPSFPALQNPERLEEERRLMYVAMTRARENLYLCYPVSIWDAASGSLLAEPSRFIRDIGDELLERWSLQFDRSNQF
ncbi:MAG: ATP-dependent helicase [Candidatus Riflebacteria bacterium]|nr:ATP-dependent helicase [Candidatus Riflebacteria bacterium]